MHGAMNVKFPNNTSKWQMEFNSAFKGLMKLEYSPQIFEKYSNTIFHENPSSGSRVFQMRKTDMTKPIVAFRNFANAPENEQVPSKAYL
jgi:hypothetical protein